MAERVSDDERKAINRERQYAVREAWNRERELVLQGKGTREWTKEEQAQIIQNGKAEGYYGHHMVSVANNRELAGDPNNIQFLTKDEHIQGAHEGKTQNLTSGYYNYKTGEMEPFENGQLKQQEVIDLQNPMYGERVGQDGKMEGDEKTSNHPKTDSQPKDHIQDPDKGNAEKSSEKTGAGASSSGSSTAEGGKGMGLGSSTEDERSGLGNSAENTSGLGSSAENTSGLESTSENESGFGNTAEETSGLGSTTESETAAESTVSDENGNDAGGSENDNDDGMEND